jgi:hypothetical protein
MDTTYKEMLRTTASQLGAGSEQGDCMFDLRLSILCLRTSWCSLEEGKINRLDLLVSPLYERGNIEYHSCCVPRGPDIICASSGAWMDLEKLGEPRERLVSTSYSSKNRDCILALEQIIRVISQSASEERPVK